MNILLLLLKRAVNEKLFLDQGFIYELVSGLVKKVIKLLIGTVDSQIAGVTTIQLLIDHLLIYQLLKILFTLNFFSSKAC